MLKATILKEEPKEKIKSLKKSSIDSKALKRCKEYLTVEDVVFAIDRLGLKYKRLDEVDIYNILVYILDFSKEKDR